MKVNDTMTLHSKQNQESEVALLIWSRQPQQVVVRIAKLSSIADCQLVPCDPLEMRDLYFDTQDRAFEPIKLALRVREFGATRLLALKGPSRPTDWGGVERLEIEGPWSEDALTRVVKALADRGIDTPRQWRFSEGQPRQVLADLGFQVIQDRETRRQVRNIVRAGEEGGPVLGEMAIDSVLYRLDRKEILHHEVEIEAKMDTGVAAITPITADLVAMFGDVLKVWDHSKLAIGFALEELLKRGDLEGLLDLDGNLMPAAYDKIDDYLTNGDG
jgi:hypothetical protein